MNQQKAQHTSAQQASRRPSQAGRRPVQANPQQLLESPDTLRPEDLLHAQQQLGNQAVQRALQDQQAQHEEPSDEGLTDSQGNLKPEISGAIQQKRGGGSPLPQEIQSEMKKKMGRSFSNVRIHTDSQADALSRKINARAFTIGSDIFFRGGVFAPSSSRGRETLVHELTHVVQQSGSRSSSSQLKLGEKGNTFEQQAERTASRVTSGQTGTAVSTGSVQRESIEEEELQMEPIEEEELQMEPMEEEELQMEPIEEEEIQMQPEAANTVQRDKNSANKPSSEEEDPLKKQNVDATAVKNDATVNKARSRSNSMPGTNSTGVSGSKGNSLAHPLLKRKNATVNLNSVSAPVSTNVQGGQGNASANAQKDDSVVPQRQRSKSLSSLDASAQVAAPNNQSNAKAIPGRGRSKVVTSREEAKAPPVQNQDQSSAATSSNDTKAPESAAAPAKKEGIFSRMGKAMPWSEESKKKRAEEAEYQKQKEAHRKQLLERIGSKDADLSDVQADEEKMKALFGGKGVADAQAKRDKAIRRMAKTGDTKAYEKMMMEKKAREEAKAGEKKDGDTAAASSSSGVTSTSASGNVTVNFGGKADEKDEKKDEKKKPGFFSKMGSFVKSVALNQAKEGMSQLFGTAGEEEEKDDSKGKGGGGTVNVSNVVAGGGTGAGGSSAMMERYEKLVIENDQLRKKLESMEAEKKAKSGS